MGSCLSLCNCITHHHTPRANVVTYNGELLQYPLPTTVSQVLQSDGDFSSFLCNSDCLYFDDYIPALPLDEELQSNQIYFLLPKSKLLAPLPASEMAALAVTASAALHLRRNKRNSQISPLLGFPGPDPNPQSNHTVGYRNKPGSGSRLSKLRRYSSRRAKMAVRSFRTKLNTISEGSSFHYSDRHSSIPAPADN